MSLLRPIHIYPTAPLHSEELQFTDDFGGGSGIAFGIYMAAPNIPNRRQYQTIINALPQSYAVSPFIWQEYSHVRESVICGYRAIPDMFSYHEMNVAADEPYLQKILAIICEIEDVDQDIIIPSAYEGIKKLYSKLQQKVIRGFISMTADVDETNIPEIAASLPITDFEDVMGQIRTIICDLKSEPEDEMGCWFGSPPWDEYWSYIYDDNVVLLDTKSLDTLTLSDLSKLIIDDLQRVKDILVKYLSSKHIIDIAGKFPEPAGKLASGSMVVGIASEDDNHGFFSIIRPLTW